MFHIPICNIRATFQPRHYTENLHRERGWKRSGYVQTHLVNELFSPTFLKIKTLQEFIKFFMKQLQEEKKNLRRECNFMLPQRYELSPRMLC